jgi:glycerol-3-phosphate O-acyltransferase / dihydroxyacetone phosphate acyltransferase
LKAGIAAIAFGAMEKYAVNVPIVPVGLNYYRGHRFRGRVVIEFGAPLRIDKEMYQNYRQSKKEGYKQLLTRVEESMNGRLRSLSFH